MSKNIARSSVERVIEIPAKSGTVPGSYSLDVVGESFYLIDCSGEVSIATDLSPFKTYRKSTGERFTEDQSFKRLEFRNDGDAVSVRVWAGWGQYIDRRFEMVEAYTSAKGWNSEDQLIAANSSVIITPVRTFGVISRKAVIITNLDPNSVLRVEDSAGNTFMSVFPRTNVSLPLSDTFRIWNDTGEAIACNIGEINYVERRQLTEIVSGISV